MVMNFTISIFLKILSIMQSVHCNQVMAKGDAREVGHTISDSSQYLACIMFINLFSASIKL